MTLLGIDIKIYIVTLD